MKKFLLSTAFAVLATTLVVAQSTVVDISNKVKVTFPVKAEKSAGPMEGMNLFTTEVVNDKSYIGISLDMSAMGLTADVISAMGPMLFQEIKGGMMGKMMGAKITKEETTTFKGKSALYLELDGSESQDSKLKGKKLCMYIFFIDATMHQLGVYGKNPTKEEEKEFFESTVIAG
jgi:hypothetical protein